MPLLILIIIVLVLMLGAMYLAPVLGVVMFFLDRENNNRWIWLAGSAATAFLVYLFMS